MIPSHNQRTCWVEHFMKKTQLLYYDHAYCKTMYRYTLPGLCLLFQEFPFSFVHVLLQVSMKCMSNVGYIWLTNQSLHMQTMQWQFCQVGAWLLSNGKWFYYSVVCREESGLWNSATKSCNCCKYFRCNPGSTLGFLGVQSKVKAVSPLLVTQWSALCPRHFELALSCMGTWAHSQMQYFPSIFCQNTGLWKQNTVKSLQDWIHQLNICQQTIC